MNLYEIKTWEDVRARFPHKIMIRSIIKFTDEVRRQATGKTELYAPPEILSILEMAHAITPLNPKQGYPDLAIGLLGDTVVFVAHHSEGIVIV